MRHINHDPVRTVVELLARGLPRLDWPIDDLHPLWNFVFRGVTLQRISSGGRDRARRHKQARPWNVSAFNGLFDAHVAITRTFGFHITQRGEALFERAPHRDCRPSRAERQRILEQLNVVSALGGLFTLQKNVGGGINQPRKHRGLREVDHLRASGNMGAGFVRDVANEVAANGDDLIAAGRIRHAIDQHTRTNERHDLSCPTDGYIALCPTAKGRAKNGQQNNPTLHRNLRKGWIVLLGRPRQNPGTGNQSRAATRRGMRRTNPAGSTSPPANTSDAPTLSSTRLAIAILALRSVVCGLVAV